MVEIKKKVTLAAIKAIRMSIRKTTSRGKYFLVAHPREFTKTFFNRLVIITKYPFNARYVIILITKKPTKTPFRNY